MKAKRLAISVRARNSLALVIGCAVAYAQASDVARAAPNAFTGFKVAAYVYVHDTTVDPTIRTYTGTVVALGVPSTDGKVYAFKVAPTGPRNFPLTNDDLRGWRLTLLTGKRFSRVFTVQSNTASEVTVTVDKGSLDGVAVQDLFVIESVDGDGASLFPAPDGERHAAAPGA
jgi:hypothetical protein